jgi:RNA recognition motif-containing protein
MAQSNGLRYVTDPNTGYSSGFAFVAMTDDSEAARAVANLNGTTVSGTALKVEEARPRLQRSKSATVSKDCGLEGDTLVDRTRMTHELDDLIQQQISTFKQDAQISNSDLADFRQRSQRIRALCQSLSQQAAELRHRTSPPEGRNAGGK